MIKFKLTEGGSPYGITSLLQVYGCQRRVSLDREMRNNRDPEEPMVLDNHGKSVGTMFHAFMELHHTVGLLDPTEVEFWNPDREVEIHPKALIEAERLFLSYIENYAGESFGHTLGVEVDIPGDSEFIRPNVEEAIVEAFGSKRTARIDRLAALTRDDCDSIEESRGITLKEGVYSIDYKTEHSRRATLVDEYLNSVQGLFYQHLIQVAMPGIDYQGHIFDIVIKNKTPVFLTVVCELPTDSEIQALKEIIRNGDALSTSDMCNPARCFDWFKMCSHLETGRCNRI